jgi:hypothetical protein
LIGAGLPNVRYGPVAIRFRIAAKRRDGPQGDIARQNCYDSGHPMMKLYNR